MPTSVVEVPTALGHARISPEALSRIVAKALGCERAKLSSVGVEVVDYPIGSIATGALLRCHGTAVDERDAQREWSIFIKLLQSARVWPMLHLVPEHLRSQYVEQFPWRTEIEAQRSAALTQVLPAGMRKARLYEVVEIDDDHAALWMEDVDVSTEPWTGARFERAARLLGILAGRRPVESPAMLGDPLLVGIPCEYIRKYVEGRVRFGLLPAILNDDAWNHPALDAELSHAGESGMRSELVDASDRIDDWLAAMSSLPQTLVHGDASPQNLLVPRSAPETFVVIDWGFTSLHCVGFDLGQLLVGLVNASELPCTSLPSIRDAIVPAYTEGLLSTGFDASEEQVTQGFVLSVLVRSLFSAIPLEELDRPDSPGLRERLRNRIGLTRFLLDQVAALG
jgi:hypothetical protein